MPFFCKTFQDVAEKLGLDTQSPISLWKDEALVEINKAVLYSYKVFPIKVFFNLHNDFTVQHYGPFIFFDYTYPILD